MEKPTIGFIGLGLMGTAMAENLLDRGYPMVVLGNRDRSGIEKALAAGAHEAQTAKEVAEKSDIVMLCMGTSEHVEGRMRGDDGVIAGLSEGKVVIDFGTSLPSSTIALGQDVAAAGATYMDSPIGRTPADAREGNINLMVSGDASTFDRIKPVLDEVGGNVFHLGELGSGHTVKLLNNFLGMMTANAVSEIFAVCDLAGIPRQKVYDVISAGPLHSGMMGFVAEYALNNDPDKLAFAIKNGRKDIGYYDQMIKDLGGSSDLVQGPIMSMDRAIDEGHADEMIPIMIDHFKKYHSEKN